MFETAELGRKVDKKTFAQEEPKLHTALLEAQRALRDANVPLLVIVSGVEGAGKGEVVNLLNEWLDARGVRTEAFWEETDEERERPRYWRFWRVMPPRGTVGIMFGSWYTEPIVRHALGETDTDAFERELTRIVEFEQLLIDDGALVVKFWFHLSEKDQQKRLSKQLGVEVASPQLRKYSKHYRHFAGASERAIRVTDTGPSPWYVIEATDRRYRDLTVGRTLLLAMERRLEARPDPHEPAGTRPPPPPLSAESARTVLDTVDLGRTISSKSYEKQLTRHQTRLRHLAWKAKAQKRSSVLVFEGWDAAGKGGAIRRITRAVDARLFRVIPVSAPTDEERAQHYLWRFWRHVPRAGYMTLYDRSWYGRVLVERVEGLLREDEWLRAYQEINDFEEQLFEHGALVMKFWIHIGAEEQLARFQEREQTAWKKHKITAEDWRNRSSWTAYESAIDDMVSRTNTSSAPWTLIAGNDKRAARVDVLKAVCERLEGELD